MNNNRSQNINQKASNTINLSDRNCKIALAFEYLTITTIVANLFVFWV